MLKIIAAFAVVFGVMYLSGAPTKWAFGVAAWTTFLLNEYIFREQ